MSKHMHMTIRDIEDFLAGRLSLGDHDEAEDGTPIVQPACEDVERAVRVDQHLDTCRACQDEVEFFASLAAQLVLIRPQPKIQALGQRGATRGVEQEARPAAAVIVARHADASLRQAVRDFVFGNTANLVSGSCQESQLGKEGNTDLRARVHRYLRGAWDVAMYAARGPRWSVLVLAAPDPTCVKDILVAWNELTASDIWSASRALEFSNRWRDRTKRLAFWVHEKGVHEKRVDEAVPKFWCEDPRGPGSGSTTTA